MFRQRPISKICAPRLGSAGFTVDFVPFTIITPSSYHLLHLKLKVLIAAAAAIFHFIRNPNLNFGAVSLFTETAYILWIISQNYKKQCEQNVSLPRQNVVRKKSEYDNDL